MSATVMVVEDEPNIGALVRTYLERAGYRAVWVRSGEEALAELRRHPVRLVVLDIGLPGIDGFEVCRRLRASDVWAPVLMLTAREAVDDRVAGLDAGADDYLAKPFAFDELLARLRALVRRAPGERPTLLTVGDLRLDPAAHRAWRSDRELELSAKEFALLEVFMRNAGAALSRDALLDGAWDMAYERRSNIIDVYVRALRGKIGRGAIETVRGVGYRLRDRD
jgi:two-component system OmpR family response regulator